MQRSTQATLQPSTLITLTCVVHLMIMCRVSTLLFSARRSSHRITRHNVSSEARDVVSQSISLSPMMTYGMNAGEPCVQKARFDQARLLEKAAALPPVF